MHQCNMCVSITNQYVDNIRNQCICLQIKWDISLEITKQNPSSFDNAVHMSISFLYVINLRYMWLRENEELECFLTS